MTILTGLGYLILCVLAWAGIHVLVFIASRAWHRGKAQAESQALQEIRRLVLVSSLNSKEALRMVSEQAKITRTLLDVTGDMSRSFTEWAEGEMNQLMLFCTVPYYES